MTKKMYVITAYHKSKEYLLIESPEYQFPYAFITLELAKAEFNLFYSNVPSGDPTPDQLEIMSDLVNLNPVIVELEVQQNYQQLTDALVSKEVSMISGNRLRKDFYFFQIKKGFIANFKVLDILEDIQNQIYISKNGEMEKHRFILLKP